MQTTADSDSVPTKETVASRLADATGHRVKKLTAQYRHITGTEPDASDPEEICADLTTWLQNNESTAKTLLEEGTATFEEVSFDSLEVVFDTAWNGGQIDEGELVASDVRTQAEMFEQVRDVMSGNPGPWAQLAEAGKMLRDEHPKSPTTDSVGIVLGKSKPPKLQRVEALIEESKDPKPPRPDGEAWANLLSVAEELREDLPNAEITDTVTAAVDADERPSEARTSELLSEATTILERMRTAQQRLDDLDDGDIVLIEGRE
jgi:hypothetical protein